MWELSNCAAASQVMDTEHMNESTAVHVCMCAYQSCTYKVTEVDKRVLE